MDENSENLERIELSLEDLSHLEFEPTDIEWRIADLAQRRVKFCIGYGWIRYTNQPRPVFAESSVREVGFSEIEITIFDWDRLETKIPYGLSGCLLPNSSKQLKDATVPVFPIEDFIVFDFSPECIHLAGRDVRAPSHALIYGASVEAWCKKVSENA